MDKPELRDVGAARQLDSYRALAAFRQVVMIEAVAQLANVHANRGIGAGVVSRPPIEHLDPDGVLFDVAAAPGKRALNQELQEPAQALRSGQRRTRQNLLQMGANPLFVR